MKKDIEAIRLELIERVLRSALNKEEKVQIIQIITCGDELTYQKVMKIVENFRGNKRIVKLFDFQLRMLKQELSTMKL